MFPLNTKILVVDDIESLRELLKAYLDRLGYTNIQEAEDGKLALEMLWAAHLAAKPFELVISDWNMPNLNGLELLEAIRQKEHWKTLPFLFLTTESEKDKVLSAAQRGASNYIVKPIDEPLLKEKLQKIWDRLKK